MDGNILLRFAQSGAPLVRDDVRQTGAEGVTSDQADPKPDSPTASFPAWARRGVDDVASILNFAQGLHAALPCI